MGEEGTIAMHYSVTAITLRYILALTHNALKLWRKVIASKSYCTWHKEVIIATDSYLSGNILPVIALKLLLWQQGKSDNVYRGYNL
jgi:hypothetical protein